jgi:hypothetical protein
MLISIRRHELRNRERTLCVITRVIYAVRMRNAHFYWQAWTEEWGGDTVQSREVPVYAVRMRSAHFYWQAWTEEWGGDTVQSREVPVYAVRMRIAQFTFLLAAMSWGMWKEGMCNHASYTVRCTQAQCTFSFGKHELRNGERMLCAITRDIPVYAVRMRNAHFQAWAAECGGDAVYNHESYTHAQCTFLLAGMSCGMWRGHSAITRGTGIRCTHAQCTFLLVGMSCGMWRGRCATGSRSCGCSRT